MAVSFAQGHTSREVVGSRIQTQAVRLQSLSPNPYHDSKHSTLMIFALWILHLNALYDGSGALHRVGGICMWLPWGHCITLAFWLPTAGNPSPLP